MKLRSVFCFLPAAVLTGFMLFVVLGCATGGTARYVGTWLGRSAKAKDGTMVKLDAGGGGYAMTYVGAVPLKWRETDANRLDVRFGCGDGGIMVYDMSYSPECKTLNLLSQKSICFRTGRVSAEQTFDDMVLLCSNEYSQAMAPAIEYTSKALEFHAKEKARQRQSRPEFVTNCMSFASWDEVGRLGSALLDGWSVSLYADTLKKQRVSIKPGGQQGQIEITLFGGGFVIGNLDDKSEYEDPGEHGVWIPVEDVPPNATPLPGETSDAEMEADIVRRMREKGWTVRRVVYYEEHFFHGLFHVRHTVKTGGASVDEVVGSLRECLGDVMKPPLTASLWKLKPKDAGRQ